LFEMHRSFASLRMTMTKQNGAACATPLRLIPIADSDC
jgi:hypothetical protein